MDKIVEQIFEEERALYGLDGAVVEGCTFFGPKDGESPLKECKNVLVKNSSVSLRYPFWHNHNLVIESSKLSDSCRAPLWYDDKVLLDNVTINGVKAVRECKNVSIIGSHIESEEFAWMVDGIAIKNSYIKGVYPFMRVNSIVMKDSEMEGKYSFQYCQNGAIEDCKLITKDAFWHTKNMVIKNCKIIGEYIGWYSENLTLKNCVIESIQPFCYCKNLIIDNCVMEKCDLAFERSEVKASIKGDIISIKNPISGMITCRKAGEIIFDGDVECHCEIKEGR